MPYAPLPDIDAADRPDSACPGLGTAGKANGIFDQQQLAVRFVAGESDAAQAVVERFQPRVARLVQRLLAWPADVADVVQDVFVAVLEARGKFRASARLETWLVRITINMCRAHNRRRWLRGKLLAAWIHAPHERRYADAHMRVARSGGVPAQPDRIAIDDERARLVREAIAALPQKYREVVVLHYLEQMTATEAAQVLGLRINTVEVRLNRARKCLAASLSHLADEVL